MKRLLMPWARGAKHAVLKRIAEWRIVSRSAGNVAAAPMRCAFVIGCGRSGTTLVGAILARHADVKYFFEPYHLWSTIDPDSDVLNRHHVGPCKFLLDKDDANAEARRRFGRLLVDPARRRGARLMVEKTPMNACRIGYLEALTGGARYLHLVRDGVDVCRSIDRLSRDRSFRIIGMPGLGRWWGRNDSKWKALFADGAIAGYFPDDLPLIDDFEARGAYEWLVSLAEVDRWRGRLGGRLMEMTYDQLTTDPRGSLTAICQFMDLPILPQWFEASVAQIEPPRRSDGGSVTLPPKMCEAFNAAQIRLGFSGRAVPSAARDNPAVVRMV